MAKEIKMNEYQLQAGGDHGESKSSIPNDLPDNEQDKIKLEAEEIIMDLPDVKDIPGQEFIHVLPMGELADTTIASDDEEGINVIGLADDDETDGDDEITAHDHRVSRDEKAALADANFLPTHDENNLRVASLDDVDFDGEPLNEGSFGQLQSGSDLDVPGADANSLDIGNTVDEENDLYSLDGDDNDKAENNAGV